MCGSTTVDGFLEKKRRLLEVYEDAIVFKITTNRYQLTDDNFYYEVLPYIKPRATVSNTYKHFSAQADLYWLKDNGIAKEENLIVVSFTLYDDFVAECRSAVCILEYSDGEDDRLLVNYIDIYESNQYLVKDFRCGGSYGNDLTIVNFTYTAALQNFGGRRDIIELKQQIILK